MNDSTTTSRPNHSRLRPLALGIAACLAVSALPLHAEPRLDVLRERVADGRIVLPPGTFERIEATLSRPAPVPAATTRFVTNCNDSGAGSLRDTIGAADTDDTIDLTQLTCSRITLTSGEIVFGQANLAIQGAGSGRITIDGGLSSGIFVGLGSGTFEVGGVSMENGFKYRSDATALGGCVQVQGNVVLDDVQMRNCNALSTGNRSALGGAVWAQGQVLLQNSVITGSMAKATGFGYASGGGVYARNGFVSKYSTISNNVAISESATPTFGGGVFVWNGGLIVGSTISANQAARMGGIATKGASTYTLSMVNSTVSGNVANRFGGIFAVQKLNLYNSTIAFNTSHEWDTGAGYYLGAGVHISVAGEMDSTIIANNVNTGAPAAFPTADLTGKPGSGFNGGHNNVGLCGAPCPNDTTHEDPGLHPLQDNGGRTRTHVPTPGQWDTFGGSNVLGWTWDQRGPGFPRQSPGDWPEIGALQINSDIILANGFN
ncbi:choice-of-anchor Q domain-containing protein [Dokdonella sp.]|uniref:choice-of-anchor Q domain-containing protein n=1 Tax=Dokdonella sp. TaxID=2291710 RepID=UPI003782DCA2